MPSAELLVIGAGPYGLAVSAHARHSGIDTVTLGAPMGFWHDHMPADMFLRSGPDWHLDASGRHTFEAYLAERRITPAEVDPIPISVYLEYADWFTGQKGLPVEDVRVRRLRRGNGRVGAEPGGGGAIPAGGVGGGPRARGVRR